MGQDDTMDADSHTTMPSGSGAPGSEMPHRVLGRTGRPVSIISLGTWQLGADWGEVRRDDAQAVLEAAVEAGVTMFDTADVYGDGRSEQVIAEFLAAHPGLNTFVATKMGRRADQTLANYSMANFRAWTDRSRSNLRRDTLDLVQLHCPPTEVINSDQVFDDLDTLVAEGVMAAYGVSVETADQALAAIARPSVASVQIIINAFRIKPLERVLPAAREAGVGIIARVPLASGLLSGRYDESTTFAADDHRTYNRHGESFDRGETFSGVDYDQGVSAAREFSALAASRDLPPARAALAWVAQLDGVTTVIPGARSPEQARQNATAGSVPPLGEDFTAAVTELYDLRLRDSIHDLW
jgi:aryl-alcohol dehydrogenase-like predicted oxidoreductase